MGQVARLRGTGRVQTVARGGPVAGVRAL